MLKAKLAKEEEMNALTMAVYLLLLSSSLFSSTLNSDEFFLHRQKVEQQRF